MSEFREVAEAINARQFWDRWGPTIAALGRPPVEREWPLLVKLYELRRGKWALIDEAQFAADMIVRKRTRWIRIVPGLFR